MFCRIESEVLFVIAFILISAKSAIAALDECPGSDVPSIRKRATAAEVSLVFYYAAWNQESRAAKSVYAELARYHSDNVYFAAVDCWHFSCNCSRTHEVTAAGSGAPNKWPTLMVGYGRSVSLQYNGEWNFATLTRFLENLFKPLERVHSKKELKALSMRCDAVVLGLFPQPEAVEYRVFTTASVKWLETDPERSYCFAVAFGVATDDILRGIRMPQIMLISRKGIEVFNDSSTNSRLNTKWNARKIVAWTKSELKRAFSDVSGYSTPATLSTRLRNGPVLVVFANDLTFPQHFYTVMANITHHAHLIHYSHLVTCDALWRKAPARSHYQYLPNQTTDLGLLQCQQPDYFSLDLQHYYFINEEVNNIYRQMKYSLNDGTIAENEWAHDFTTEKLLQQYRYSACLLQHHYHTPEVRIAIAKSLQKSADKLRVESLSPRNRTLSVVILDTAKYEDFLSALSISSNSCCSVAAVSIVDPQLESIFVMQEPFTYDTFMQFVQRYYAQQLVATHQASSYLHLPSALNAVYLKDFNRQMLLSAIEQSNVTSVVLLYSPTCAFSTIYAHTLTQLETFLNTDGIKFMRLNTQGNELPWEFVMHSTPTLIVFPRGRSAESRIFPSHLKANVRNVLGFILAQLDPVDQTSTVWSSCRNSLLPQQLKKCLRFAKTLVMQHIGNHLKFWQIFESERQLVLDRLKEFKDISLKIRSFRV